MRDATAWLIVEVFEGERLIHDDGLHDTGDDAVQVLTEVFGAFVSANCLRRPDLATVRAELRAGNDIRATIDGRDWS